MPLADLLPVLGGLDCDEKRKAIQFLVAELADEKAKAAPEGTLLADTTARADDHWKSSQANNKATATELP